MPIISVEIMKTIDEREMQKTTKEKQTKTERSKGNRSYSERVKTKWFCCAFKLGFPQLICKASLIFKEMRRLKNLYVDWNTSFKKCNFYLNNKHIYNYHQRFMFSTENFMKLRKNEFICICLFQSKKRMMIIPETNLKLTNHLTNGYTQSWLFCRLNVWIWSFNPINSTQLCTFRLH